MNYWAASRNGDSNRIELYFFSIAFRSNSLSDKVMKLGRGRLGHILTAVHCRWLFPGFSFFLKLKKSSFKKKVKCVKLKPEKNVWFKWGMTRKRESYIFSIHFNALIMRDTNQSSFASDILRHKNKLLLNPWNRTNKYLIKVRNDEKTSQVFLIFSEI